MVEQLTSMKIGDLKHFSGKEASAIKPVAYKLKHDTDFNCEIFVGNLDGKDGIFIRRLNDYTPQK